MENLKINEKVVDDHFKTIERDFNIFKNEKSYSLKNDLGKNLKKEINSIKNEIEIFDLYLNNIEEKEKNNFTKKIDTYNKKIKTYEENIEKIFKKLTKKPVVINFENDEKNNEEMGQEDFFDMEKEKLIKHVDKNLIEADKNLEEIILDLNKGKNIMQEINIEIRRQQEKMNQMEEKIKETYSLTKKSKKMINYFKRNMMTDKIICTLIVLVCIAIIIIIILKFMGYKTETSFNDVGKR